MRTAMIEMMPLRKTGFVQITGRTGDTIRLGLMAKTLASHADHC